MTLPPCAGDRAVPRTTPPSGARPRDVPLARLGDRQRWAFRSQRVAPRAHRALHVAYRVRKNNISDVPGGFKEEIGHSSHPHVPEFLKELVLHLELDLEALLENYVALDSRPASGQIFTAASGGNFA